MFFFVHDFYLRSVRIVWQPVANYKAIDWFFCAIKTETENFATFWLPRHKQ